MRIPAFPSAVVHTPVAVSLLVLLVAPPALAQTAGSSSAWWSQIGLTSSILTSANYGSGVTIGIVDTGIVSTNAEVTGRVLAASSCAAVTFKCSNGVSDDNSHGTAVASIAAGSTLTGGKMSGVAAKATIVAEKVLNASGTGYDTDVANGIRKAADAGASVINLSLTYLPTTAVVSAINYAASKGVVIVNAGGNSATLLNGGANTTGLTADALKRLVLVGSVNSSNQKSSFSNTPGTAKAGTATYASLWLMAPGENITAPLVTSGSTAYGAWTGTSMAAPVVSGAIALLEARWPVLKTNGTASSVLFTSATDLGTKGADATYGNGLINLTKAFTAAGTLSVPTATGTTGTSAVLVSNGTIGTSGLKSVLQSVSAFDSYQRDFTINMASGITSKKSSDLAMLLPSQSQSFMTKLLNGGQLGFDSVTPADPLRLAVVEATRLFDSGRSENASKTGTRISYLGPQEQSVSLVRGLSLSQSFSDAAAPQSAFGASGTSSANALLGLVENGTGMALGRRMGENGRVAFGFTSSGQSSFDSRTSTHQTMQAMALAYHHTLQPGWTVGATTSMLKETGGLLGSASGGAVALGNHQSTAFSLGTDYRLTDTMALALDATYSATSGGRPGSGLVDQVSGLQAVGLGAALVRRDAARAGDLLAVGLSKPLQVVSGHADLTVPVGADDAGTPIMRKMSASLVPTGSQTDLSVGYRAPLLDGAAAATASVRLSTDQDNVAGRLGAGVSLGMKLAF